MSARTDRQIKVLKYGRTERQMDSSNHCSTNGDTLTFQAEQIRQRGLGHLIGTHWLVRPHRVRLVKVKMSHPQVLLGTTDWQMTTIGGHFTWSLTTFIGLLNQRLRYFDGATYIRRLWSVIQRWRNAEIQTYILFPPNQWFPCAPFLKLCGHAILSVLDMCRFLMCYLIKTRGGGCNKI